MERLELFTEKGRKTEHGTRLNNNVEQVLYPIIKQWVEDGASLSDISTIISDVVFDLRINKILGIL